MKYILNYNNQLDLYEYPFKNGQTHWSNRHNPIIFNFSKINKAKIEGKIFYRRFKDIIIRLNIKVLE